MLYERKKGNNFCSNFAPLLQIKIEYLSIFAYIQSIDI